MFVMAIFVRIFEYRNNWETEQMSKKPRKFEIRESKYVTNLWMWMFVMAIFVKIFEYSIVTPGPF